MLDGLAPRRHRGLRDPGIQASVANVPWLFLLELGAVGMLLAWVRRKLRIARSA